MLIKYTYTKNGTPYTAKDLDALKKYSFSKEKKEIIHNSMFVSRSHNIRTICILIDLISILAIGLILYACILLNFKRPIMLDLRSVMVLILSILVVSFICTKIITANLRNMLYKRWWSCPFCGKPLPKRYLMIYGMIIKTNIEPVVMCPYCNTTLPKSIEEAKRIIKEKDKGIELHEKEPKSIYNWGINRMIFAYIVNPYDSNGELSDDAMDWVERDNVPCIQSLFHFLIEEKEDAEGNSYTPRLKSVYTKKPDYTDAENVGKALIEFRFPDEVFYLYMARQDAEKVQKLNKEYHEENIILTEI